MPRELTEQQAVRNLQRYLRQLALVEGVLPELPVDGVYDSETRRAVSMFQQGNGLPVTGLADRETWDAIYAAYLISAAQTAKPIPLDVFPRMPTSYVIRADAVGFEVMAVQYILNEVLLFYDNSPELNISGRYDAQTGDAVRTFQGYAALPQTGEVDMETWNRLAAFYREHARHANQ